MNAFFTIQIKETQQDLRLHSPYMEARQFKHVRALHHYTPLIANVQVQRGCRTRE